LLIYTHKFFIVYGLGWVGGSFGGSVGCGLFDVVVYGCMVVGCIDFADCYYVVCGCLRVFSYFITVCEICLIVLFYNVFVAYCFNMDSFDGLASLAVCGVFCNFLIVVRAFSSSTCLVRISSSLSILRSSSYGWTAIVTVFATIVDYFVGFGGYVLDDGRSSRYSR
jgi:hypothetical protein